MAELCLIAEPDDFSVEARELLSRHFELRFGDLADSGEADRVNAIFCRLACYWDHAKLEAYPNLRWLCSPTTGLNHIDLDAINARKIQVISLKGEANFLRENITSTAEFSWALMLALWRNILPATASVLSGAWDRDAFRSLQLKGRRLGVVGMGRVGQQVRRIAEAFGMSVSYFDPMVDELPGRAESLQDLLTESDIVLLSCSYSSETRHLIGASELAYLRHNALLINTARGEIVDEAAIVDAVRAEKIYYGADVIAEETDLIRPLRLEMIALAKQSHRMVITPHIAGATSDAMKLTELHVATILEKELTCLKA